MPTYEYLFVVAIIQTNWADIRYLKGAERPRQTSTTTWFLYWPDAAEPEERPGDVAMSVLFNELGRDGWKLVTSDILDSIVAAGANPGGWYGWTDVGTPIRQRWTFVREGRG